MSGEDLAILITAVSLSSAQYLTISDLNILVAVLTQLADTYATLSVLRSFNEEKNEKNSQRDPARQQEEDIIALETS